MVIHSFYESFAAAISLVVLHVNGFSYWWCEFNDYVWLRFVTGV